ncbi:MAG: acyl carrier protein [Flavobacteriales bacterium]|jgi:acyl carrier protein|nr:acyl carrier protein [Flavobacteriales bacterium]
MTIEEILKEVNEIFIDVLDDDDIELDMNTTADDVEDWDSLTHIQLVVATEKRFKIKFTAQEIRELANVGEYCELVKQKMA